MNRPTRHTAPALATETVADALHAYQTAAGLPQPLGATAMTVKGVSGYQFAVYSPLAETMTLCLFPPIGHKDHKQHEIQFAMHRSGSIWHLWVATVDVDFTYGFRAEGNSTQTQPFNANKLLLDPYGKGVDGGIITRGKALANTDTYVLFTLNDCRDNAALAPKSRIVDETFDWGDETFPQTPWAQTIIYELHVKGFTQCHPDIPKPLRGSYAGLATPPAIDYLKQLGITAVELMPVAYGMDEPHLQQKGLHNYWNYNTLAPFAVEDRYWSGRKGTTPLSEFKHLVKTLHNAGIEVILDVVFNHSAEAEHQHPSYCQRGLANADYYRLHDDGTTVNQTGCGNTINAAHPQTRQWIMDCLCYWVEACHVDGFRFDLGATLGREGQQGDFIPHAELFAAIRHEPLLAGIKWIVEPWDIGAEGYQLGNFPTGFAEWNDRFRDDLRAFWLHESGESNHFATRFAGSSDVFAHHDKTPSHSLNLITAHDGFTLADVVSYREKHNEKNGESNRDGHNHNLSNAYGVEGRSNDPTVLAKRQAAQRALLASLLLSNGTPMLLAGDEFGHSQGGNNNAYCQDNHVTWLNWADADDDLRHFVRQCIALRRQIPALNQNHWWTADDVIWYHPDAVPMRHDDWHNYTIKALQIQLNQKFLLLINAKQEAQHFKLPDGQWKACFTPKNPDQASVIQARTTAGALSLAIFTLNEEQNHE